MGRRKRRRGCGTAVLWLLLILMLCSGALGWIYIKKYKPNPELADKSKVFGVHGEQVALILDNELHEEQGIYAEGQVYLPVEWVNQYLNERFYWDSEEELLVYALPDSIQYADKETMGERGPLFKVQSDGMYLSLGLVLNYTDIRAESFDTSQIKRVFIDTQWSAYDTATVKKEGQIREKGGVKSPIITDAVSGERVRVLETMEKWSKVRTEDGYMGYIQNKRLKQEEQVTPVSTFKAPVYTNISMDEKVRLGFHQVTRQEGNATLENYVSNTQDMNVIAPTWYNVIDSDGTYTSLASKDYVQQAHEMGLQVWAVVDNISTEESIKNLDTKVLMSSTAKRKKLIENLMKEAEIYGFDGFNLDFESLKAEAGPHYVQFIRELSVSCREKGLVLSIDNYVPAPYTSFYNRREQGIVADYVIIMGYDEHYAGGDAGPVSSLSYVKEGIENTLKEVPKEKIINGVPFFTRVWTVNEGKTTSKAYGIKDAKEWVRENKVNLEWKEDLGLYYGEVLNGSGQQKIWMEEEKSMKLKIDLIREYDLAGVGCWKLGFETPGIWDIIAEVK